MRKIIAAIIILFVAGCATTYPVDTINKKMAVFEIGYHEALALAIELRDSGQLDYDQVGRVSDLFNRIDIAREAAYAAIAANKTAVADEYLSVAQTALAAVNSILQGIKNAKRTFVNTAVNVHYQGSY